MARRSSSIVIARAVSLHLLRPGLVSSKARVWRRKRACFDVEQDAGRTGSTETTTERRKECETCVRVASPASTRSHASRPRRVDARLSRPPRSEPTMVIGSCERYHAICTTRRPSQHTRRGACGVRHGRIVVPRRPGHTHERVKEEVKPKGGEGREREGMLSKRLIEGRRPKGMLRNKLSQWEVKEGMLSKRLSEERRPKGGEGREVKEGMLRKKLSEGRRASAARSRTRRDGRAEPGSAWIGAARGLRDAGGPCRCVAGGREAGGRRSRNGEAWWSRCWIDHAMQERPGRERMETRTRADGSELTAARTCRSTRTMERRSSR